LLGDGHIVVLDATHLVARNRLPAENVAHAHGARVHHVLVTADDATVRERLAMRSRGRAADDHSDADLPVYERMRARGFEAPTTGYHEIHSGPELLAAIARV